MAHIYFVSGQVVPCFNYLFLLILSVAVIDDSGISKLCFQVVVFSSYLSYMQRLGLKFQLRFVTSDERFSLPLSTCGKQVNRFSF